MSLRTGLFLMMLACCVLLVGCKKSAAFLVVDAETQKPLTQTLVDHWTLYEFPDPSAGDPYLKGAFSLTEEGLYEIEEPKPDDTYVFRLTGYQSIKARIDKSVEKAEYLIVGGPEKLKWVELERVESEDDDDVVTFIVPLQKN